jgi:hypothetical protein
MRTMLTRWCFYIDAIQHERATGDEEERKQALLKRVVMRITHKTLSTCLLVWAEYTIAEVDKRTRMRRIILRMTGNLLGRSCSILFSCYNPICPDS